MRGRWAGFNLDHADLTGHARDYVSGGVSHLGRGGREEGEGKVDSRCLPLMEAGCREILLPGCTDALWPLLCGEARTMLTSGSSSASL